MRVILRWERSRTAARTTPGVGAAARPASQPESILRSAHRARFMDLGLERPNKGRGRAASAASWPPRPAASGGRASWKTGSCAWLACRALRSPLRSRRRVTVYDDRRARAEWSASISGLTPRMTYRFRLFAGTPDGSAVCPTRLVPFPWSEVRGGVRRGPRRPRTTSSRLSHAELGHADDPDGHTGVAA